MVPGGCNSGGETNGPQELYITQMSQALGSLHQINYGRSAVSVQVSRIQKVKTKLLHSVGILKEKRLGNGCHLGETDCGETEVGGRGEGGISHVATVISNLDFC